MYHSHSAPTERFLVPEYSAPVKKVVKSNSRVPKRYSVEDLKYLGLEFNPYVLSDYLDFVKARTEYVRSKFDKTGSQKKVSIFDRVPVDAINAYREELKRNDELFKEDEPQDIYPEDYCLSTCILF